MSVKALVLIAPLLCRVSGCDTAELYASNLHCADRQGQYDLQAAGTTMGQETRAYEALEYQWRGWREWREAHPKGQKGDCELNPRVPETPYLIPGPSAQGGLSLTRFTASAEYCDPDRTETRTVCRIGYAHGRVMQCRQFVTSAFDSLAWVEIRQPLATSYTFHV